MSGRKVLIAGGAGFIGAHAAKEVAARGDLPITYDNLSTGWRDFVRYGPFEHGDIRDGAALAAVIRRHAPELVMHFAAKSLVAESVRDPLTYYDNNVVGALSLVRACVEHEVPALVFSSTAAVYGVPATSPIPIDAPAAPVNPYGASKLAVERALADVAAATGRLGVTIFRYFNAAGADPAAEIGERHEPESHLIPNALRAALDGREMSLFGEDYPTPDGTCVRDYVHVSDLARAHAAVLDRPSAPGEVRTFNLGTGRGRSVREVLAACGEVVGAPIPVRVAGRRPGDPPSLVAGEIERATGALDWRAERSDLMAIVEDAWRWARQTMDRK